MGREKKGNKRDLNAPNDPNAYIAVFEIREIEKKKKTIESYKRYPFPLLAHCRFELSS